MKLSEESQRSSARDRFVLHSKRNRLLLSHSFLQGAHADIDQNPLDGGLQSGPASRFPGTQHIQPERWTKLTAAAMLCQRRAANANPRAGSIQIYSFMVPCDRVSQRAAGECRALQVSASNDALKREHLLIVCAREQ